MDKKIYLTGDGSHTLFVPGMNEFYHSSKGAYRESMHVFIGLGFKSVTAKKDIHILEIGFGTGLNCLLTLNEAEGLNNRVFYDTLEPNPLEWVLVEKLNYPSVINSQDVKKWLQFIHLAETDKWIKVTEHFSLRKNIIRIEDVRFPDNYYDLVYFDAFGPKAQPEMWAIENFQKTYSSMKEGGILVTYCSKGQVRRDIESVGFDVERLPGPPGKREVLRAWKR